VIWWGILRDDLIELRPLTLEDAAAHLAGEDDETRRWFAFSRPSTIEDVVGYVQRAQAGWQTGTALRVWGIHDATTDVLVGSAEARDRGEGSANISITVYPEFRRRGHATAALRLASSYVHEVLGLERAVAVIDADNVASRRVAERAGFVLDGPAEAWEYGEPSAQMLRYVLRRP